MVTVSLRNERIHLVHRRSQWATCISAIAGSRECIVLVSFHRVRIRRREDLEEFNTHKPPDGNTFKLLLPKNIVVLTETCQGYCRCSRSRFGYQWKWRDPGQCQCSSKILMAIHCFGKCGCGWLSSEAKTRILIFLRLHFPFSRL